MISAKVNVVQGFGQDFARRVNLQVKDALNDAVRVGAEEASRAAAPRRRTGRMQEMDVIQARGTADGWVAGFRSRAWYAGMQSRGTRTGITPLRFLEKGRAAARKHLVERLNRL